MRDRFVSLAQDGDAREREQRSSDLRQRLMIPPMWVYTDRGDVRRIISARRARRDERERYRQSAETL
jgi:uncharacterized DUF497 family protein